MYINIFIWSSTSLGNTGELFSRSMAVIDGSFDYMGFNDNGEPPLTDPDQPCSSSYQPTPINVSIESTPIHVSTEAPKAKKQKVAENWKRLLL